jgi:transcriptional regulator with XRE-family HTH domain
MESILYQRIKELCNERGMTINGLEIELNVGISSIQKWKTTHSPSVDKITKVATYFNVSIDYLLGRTDIKGSATELLGDNDIVSFQRAREKMTPQDRDRMMKMLKAGFEYAFNEEDNTNK